MIEALETLKSIPQWVCYKNEIKALGEKPAKMPKNPMTGGNASSTNSETWGTFLNATRAKKCYQMSGLGWVFTEETGIVGIDLDGCIDEAGRVETWADEIVQAIHSYTEISPSGRGLHIFVYGKIPKALGPAPGSQIEMYSRARYFTMTGDILPGSFEKIAHRQEALDNLWKNESERRRQENKPSRRRQETSSAPPACPTDKLKAYTEKAYLDEIAKLSMAGPGCRNDTLNRVAFNLGQFIEADLLSQTEVEITLFNLAIQLGLSDREASATIQSGINGGLNNPRTNWPTDDPDDPQDTPMQSELPPIPHNDLIYHEAITPHLDLLFNRWGLVKETVETFKIGYCDACPTSLYSPSFTTPYYLAGDLVDIRHRLLSPNGQGAYRPEIEGYPVHLFDGGLAKEDDRVILVNREFNAMLLAQHYFPVLGLPSTFKREWLKEFEGIKQVYIALDPGQGGAAQGIGQLLARSGIDARVCSLPFSPRDMLVRYGCSLEDFGRFIEQGWGVS
jgi:hypothetical protein